MDGIDQRKQRGERERKEKELQCLKNQLLFVYAV